MLKKVLKITGIVVKVLVVLTAGLALYVWWPWFTDHLYWGWELDWQSMTVGIVSHLVVIYAAFASIVKLVERRDRKNLGVEMK